MKKTMKKIVSLLLSLFMIIGCLPANVEAADPTTANVKKVMDYAVQMKDANPRPGSIGWANGQYTWDTELKKSTWRYFNGVMMDAFLMTGNAELRSYVEAFYDGNIENVADSPIVESTHKDCKDEQKGYIIGELDSVVSARPLFDLLETTRAEDYKTAIKYVYDQLKQQGTYSGCGNNYVHKQTDPTTGTPTPTDSWKTYPIGLDGLYMAETFLMDCATAIKAGKIDLGADVTAQSIYEEVYTRFHWVAENMYDSTTGLYHHGWNPSTSQGNGHFWSRGIGWYAMALVDTIEMMPEGTEKETLKADLKKLFDGMLKYQDASGLWYNVVNKDATLKENNGNKLETSGSAMMAYALMKAYNNGWVTDVTYGEAGLNAFNGVVDNKVTGTSGNYVVSDTYRSSGVCTTDADYCKNPYTDDEAKGTAALIMAATLATATSNSIGNTTGGTTEGGTTGGTEGGTTDNGTTGGNLQGSNPSTGNTATGTIPGASGTQYVLDTDGIDSGETYLIVNTNAEGNAKALKLDGSRADNAGQDVQVEGNIAKISQNADACEWVIALNNSKYVVKAQAAEQYIKPNNADLTDDSGPKITVTNKNDGQYEFNNTSDGITYYLSYNANTWQQSVNASSVYLYKKTTGSSAEKQVSFTVTPATVNMKVDEVTDLTKSVLVDGTEATAPTIEWSSDNSAIVSVTNGTLTAKSAGTATITATLSAANSQNLSTPISVSITVTVEENTPVVPTEPTEPVVPTNPTNPYDGLNAAKEPYPTYPKDGAVRINKTAMSEDFQSTGVTKVELNTAGISVKNGLDVVLVVDVSNSMGWTDDWFKGMAADQVDGAKDYDKIPDGQNVSATTPVKTEDKLDAAMQAAQDFTNILLADNKAGSASNNSISFVTFAGYDKDNIAKQDSTLVDSVQTVFTNIQDATLANSVFADTKFTKYELKTNDAGEKTGSVNYTLQIGQLNSRGTAKGTAVSGLNRGNTNYDYAFAEANKAVTTLKGNYNDYAATGRETIVVFMTDGAPSHYNKDRANGDKDDYFYGDKTGATYPLPYNNKTNKVNRYTPDKWLTKINTPNTYAEELNNNINSFYALGFDLNHGGFTGFSWTQDQLEPVLKNLAGENTVNVELADSSAALNTFYKNLANNIKYAGTHAKVTDIIDSNFTLQTTPFGVSDTKTPSTIDVIAYDLYTKSETSDASKIGTRSGDKDVLETVTFSADGTTATSDKMEGNILSTANGVTTIKAKYFTYTKDAEGKETFVWNIGDITDKEMALSYYAYLKGSMEGEATAGVYNTNESADLEYVDINGDYAKQTYRKPTVSWGSAISKVEYYLVNDAGEPVNYAGEVIPFANRIVIPHTGAPRTFNWNEEVTFSGAGYVPNGYALYEDDPKYTVIAYSGQQGTSALTIPANDTTTKRIDTDSSCANTSVAFAVKKVGITLAGYSLNPDQIVVDYGKPITTNVLANDKDILPQGATASVIGFAQYRSDAVLTNMQTNKGTTTYTGDAGQFSIENGNVKYTLTKMLDKVERVFVVVKVANSETDYYYMYQELDVIPATVMYYETDFAPNVFTFADGTTNKWSVDGTPDTDSQDDGVVGTSGMVYGYDSSYTTDTSYSDGTSYKVEGEMDSTQKDMNRFKVQSKFTFTGTGFDLISRTGAVQGMIRVDVNQNGQNIKSITVNNKSETSLELYQIPVVSVNDLSYGTYEVVIGVNAAYTNANYPQLNRGGEFHFDAVRIFDPINTEAATDDADTAAAAYLVDGEAGETIKEVHQELLTSSMMQNAGNELVPGVAYVDKNENVGITDYSNIGPNNEVYLKNGQGLVFGIDTNGQVPASIDIGAKSADGNAAQMKASLLSSKESTTPIATTETTLNTATAMFYDLANGDVLTDTTYYVKIENPGSGILSITDVKVAYGATPVTTSFAFFTDAMAISLMSIDFPVDAPVVDLPEDKEEIEKEPTVDDSKEETDVVLDSECDIKDLEVNSYKLKVKKNAKISFTTSDKVKSIEVKDQDGNVLTNKISKKTKNGITTWKMDIKMNEVGMFTYTVTGFNENQVPGNSDSISIEVYRK